MTHNFRTIAGIFCTLLLLTTAGRAQNDTTAVRECFNRYKSAILNDRGEEAAGYVDSRTLQYYSTMLELVKHADSTTLSTYSFFNKLMVLIVRHRTTKEELEPMDGKALLIYAINSGMVGKNSVARNEIGTVTVDDSFATGQLVNDGKPTPLNFHFYREEGQWKLDLTALFPTAETAMKAMVVESGEPEDEFLLTLLEMTTGQKPDASVWQPLE